MKIKRNEIKNKKKKSCHCLKLYKIHKINVPIRNVYIEKFLKSSPPLNSTIR